MARRKVLTSDVSRAWPISDAGLGAATYLFEALMGLMGDKRRWRTMPWMVTFFGILVVPLGVTSIVLVILQPLSVGAWCTLCLATAVAMVVIIPLTLDKVVAMGQFLVQSHREGKPFWLGGELPEGAEDARARNFGSPAREMLPAMTWSVSVPWTLLVSVALGIWLMVSSLCARQRRRCGGQRSPGWRAHRHLCGNRHRGVVRSIRFVNLPLAACIAIAAWFLDGGTAAARWNDLITGALLILLSLPRGILRERYGSWDRLVR